MLESSISMMDAQYCAEQFLVIRQKHHDFSIDASEKIFDPSGNLVFGYLFCLSPTGYIITSSSKTITPIIAYSFTSDAPGINQDNPLLSLLTVHVDAEQKFDSYRPIEQRERIQSEWNALLEPSMYQQTIALVKHWPPQGSTTTEGWVETQWHQEAPYNDFCPVDSSEGIRTIAGCPSITMGQILNYHQTTHGVQFNDSDDYKHKFLDTFWIDNDYEEYDFPSFPMLNNYLDDVEAHFQSNTPLTDTDVAALCFALGVACKQVYSPQVSGTYGIDQAYDAYQRIGSQQATLFYKPDNTIFDIIIDNIKIGLPVHFAVVTPEWNAGHNLVIDGYNTDDYYHLNFGWGGPYDGWYRIPDELPFELTVIEGVIVDIEKIVTAEDLEVSGSFQWSEKQGGELINDSFTLRNSGDEGSVLSWEIISIPDWGEWTITPDKGEGITPEDGEIEISVSCVLPNQRGKEFSGSITVANANNPSDRAYVPISLSLPKQKFNDFLVWDWLIDYFPSIFHFFSLFQFGM